ncbi:unnamed protein product [Adineta ricciae]|uniref:LRRCT domain-containing protein n=1 Tax=Adineta ricciae TaxID=249248 RepID=A0A813NFB4_ADIRI|nr:unnamed protein product [Adineta ricciae]CAF0864424.1 unnamed protein product [Adineta ricciae]
MFSFFLLLFVVRLNSVDSQCPSIEFCECDSAYSTITCDGNSDNQTDNTYFPSLSFLPPMEEYIFSNFKQIQPNAFENVTFPSNQSITIRLINISIIHPDAFSNSMIIPDSSTLSVDIEQSTNSSSIALRLNAFNHIRLKNLRFVNINMFNGRPIFDTSCFGEQVEIEELIFQQSGLTGFSNSIRKPANVKRLSIRECPSFTQLTAKSLPTFLSTSESLEISTTGLQLINSHTFQAWSLVLKELTIRNNPNFKVLSSNMVDGVLMELEKLDLSNNSVDSIVENYDWFAYSYIKHLILKQQQLDLFLRTKLLMSLSRLKIIDFSESFIQNSTQEDLIETYVPSMRNLVSMNVSYTNLTEQMIIDLLTCLSNAANRTIAVSLLGRTLHESHFCSYFNVFSKSPNLLRLELDETHECNCVVDLFYQDEFVQIVKNDSLKRPQCLHDMRRTRCNIQEQLSTSKCSIAMPNPDKPDRNGRNVGNEAFIGIMVGLSVFLLVLLAVGTGVAYRARANRRMTILDMEVPIENPLAVIIEERSQK